MAGFGELADLGGRNTVAVLKTIEDEFEKLEPDDIP